MKRALILGGASTVWNDIEAALKIGEFEGVVVCNDFGAAWSGDIDCWVTLHPENMATLIQRREERGYRPAKKIAYHEKRAGAPAPDIVTPYHFERAHKSASSGIFSAKVALELGFDKCVLCGVPLTMTAHFNNNGEWKHSSSFHEGFHQAVPYFADRVRSMSGYTKKVLGVPTPEWMAG